jgi:hypothetical protein
MKCSGTVASSMRLARRGRDPTSQTVRDEGGRRGPASGIARAMHLRIQARKVETDVPEHLRRVVDDFPASRASVAKVCRKACGEKCRGSLAAFKTAFIRFRTSQGR